jgi:hypothetical protein
MGQSFDQFHNSHTANINFNHFILILKMATAFKKMLKKQKEDDEHTNKRFKKSNSDNEVDSDEKSAALEEKA